MIVCIAEKPSVAGEIAKVLGARSKKDGYYEGNNYQVTWTFGHLCQLRQPDGYDDAWKKWSMSVLPMIPPKYEVDIIPEASIRKQFKIIKELYKKAEYIVNCGDPAMGDAAGRRKVPRQAPLDIIPYRGVHPRWIPQPAATI